MCLYACKYIYECIKCIWKYTEVACIWACVSEYEYINVYLVTSLGNVIIRQHTHTFSIIYSLKEIQKIGQNAVKSEKVVSASGRK